MGYQEILADGTRRDLKYSPGKIVPPPAPEVSGEVRSNVINLEAPSPVAGMRRTLERVDSNKSTGSWFGDSLAKYADVLPLPVAVPPVALPTSPENGKNNPLLSLRSELSFADTPQSEEKMSDPQTLPPS